MRHGCWYGSFKRPDKPAREYTLREQGQAITDLTAAGIHGGTWPDWSDELAARECWVATVEAFEQVLYREWPRLDRECPECSGPMTEMGDGLTCLLCGAHRLPCPDCGGWITRYVGIIKGDDVSECPDCGHRYHAAAPEWELRRRRG